MNTTRNPETGQAEGTIMRFYDWMNEKLYPLLGPADLSPYTPALDKSMTGLCPICGVVMADHVFDRSTPDITLYCPSPEIPRQADDRPLNEFGVPRD